ncbi:hypothetical protein DAPPUDRAFT_319820 [Daphnia pulex]|uniref:Major facilitator superfamily associated domain-containing protein n=1 Tax=Daphnia pulex TaxID=6669 RepID=E9GMX8_DAPPU|nr:hypothetical protein DAPPUDRAFT_319820 [Daphnia pulex]|eukprot:EFX79171.1 hypothetical protein DAPPUDRAFT_319820 [Daphnia pulex]
MTRFFAFRRNPWILIATESLEGFSGFLGIVTGSYYCAAAAPPGMLASLNGIFSAAAFGLGRGIGTSVGSLLISSYGIRSTYLLLSMVAGSVAILYLVVYHLVLKKLEHKRLMLTRSEQGEATAQANGDSSSSLKDDIQVTPL